MKITGLTILIFAITLTSIAAVSATQKKQYIIEFQNIPSDSEIQIIRENFSSDIARMSSYSDSDYFKRAYKISLHPHQLKAIKSSIKINEIEDVVTFTSESIIPSSGNDQISDDTFANYQWGLKFNGQQLTEEKSDIESIVIDGNENSDINISRDLIKNIENKINKDVIVAVIDTGIDHSHPDLKNSIFINKLECPDGVIPFNPKQDLDHNGYIGDCSGLDFTSDQGIDNRPEDLIGHGTHVAGIIAAASNNDEGVSGLSNKIKILPLKVLSNRQSKNTTTAIGLSDRLAEAILYAVKMKVDVINLSIGIPISMDKNHIRMAVAEAIKNNIAVIAAAGNNNSDGMIIPCAYSGVICVGATTITGDTSSFTNFGGHVDILAPGDNILSTFPTGLEPLIFSTKGYEIKSGTSQAAPFVAGALALLKGLRPSYDITTLKSRLFSSSNQTNKISKNSLFGLIDINKLLSNINSDIPYPQFKELGQIVIGDKNQFTIKIPIFNLQKNLRITILPTANIEYQQTEYDIKHLGQSEIEINGKISNLLMDSRVEIKLKFTSDASTRTFTHTTKISKEPTKNEQTLSKSIAIQSQLMASLRTIDSGTFDLDSPDYYLTRELNSSIEIDIYKHIGLNIIKQDTITIPNAASLLSIFKQDFNGDNSPDYLLRTLEIHNNEQSIHYHFYDNELNPLWKNIQSSWPLIFEHVILDNANFATLQINIKNESVPVFIFKAIGPQPKSDQPNNKFDDIDKTNKPRIYGFSPIKNGDAINLQTHEVPIRDYVTENFEILFNDDIVVSHLIPQTDADRVLNQFRVIIAVGNNYLKKNYVLTIRDIFDFSKWSHQELDIEIPTNLSIMNKTVDLIKGTWNGVSLTSSAGDALRTYITTLRPDGLATTNYVLQKDWSEPMLDHIVTAIKNDTTLSVFQTRSKLLAKIFNGKQIKTFSFPTHISSFLTGEILKEGLYVLPMKDKIAIYVDASPVTMRNIYVMFIDENGITAPIANSLHVPLNCMAKNPVKINGKIHFTLGCSENGKSMIKYIEVND